MNQPPLPQKPNCQSEPKPPAQPCPEPEPPCPDPEPEPEPPCPEPKPPCPEPEPPCAEPKPPKPDCPERTCPDPITPPPAPPCEEAPPCEAPQTPSEQLAALRQELDAGQREMLKFEPLKNSLEDLAKRIEALDTALAALPESTADYTEFFRAVERQRSEIECGIPTVRCQLDLSDKQKACVDKAIETVDARVKKAQSDSEAQALDLKTRRAKQRELDENAAWVKRWYEFFSQGLREQITKQRDLLKELDQLSDPSKDQCEVWFYLSDMEAMLTSGRTDDSSPACYDEAINLATFLDCWSPECYSAAYQHWIVAFNEAEAAQKRGAAELAQAEKHAEALAELARTALASRREWILKEIKAKDCCGLGGKCP